MSQPLLQSVENALKIMELFNGPVQELSLTEISQQLDLGKSTVHRLLTTMEDRQFIEQNAENNRYRLGLKVIQLSASKLSHLNIIDECHPHLVDLSARTGESCHLSFYSQGEITFVDKVTGHKPAMMSSIIGYRLPAYASSSGKMFLAHMDRDELERYLATVQIKPLTPYTILDVRTLRNALEMVRRQGFSEDQQETEEGLVCVAAPVLGRSGRMLAAISLSGAASRINREKVTLVTELKNAALQCSRCCGLV